MPGEAYVSSSLSLFTPEHRAVYDPKRSGTLSRILRESRRHDRGQRDGDDDADDDGVSTSRAGTCVQMLHGGVHVRVALTDKQTNKQNSEENVKRQGWKRERCWRRGTKSKQKPNVHGVNGMGRPRVADVEMKSNRKAESLWS